MTPLPTPHLPHQVTIALADGLLMTEGHDSEAEEALVQQTMFVLSQVHVKCAQAGDQFLEVVPPPAWIPCYREEFRVKEQKRPVSGSRPPPGWIPLCSTWELVVF